MRTPEVEVNTGRIQKTHPLQQGVGQPSAKRPPPAARTKAADGHQAAIRMLMCLHQHGVADQADGQAF
ncbi:MAG: hypothetical protein Q8R59_00625, partial [Polaromonas sp.]|nr:hypothetical protein [Polaromonas sp.]